MSTLHCCRWSIFFIASAVMSCVLTVQHTAAQEGTAKGGTLMGPGFALVGGGSGEQGCLPRTLSQDQLRRSVSEANNSLGIDPDFVVVLSLDVPTCAEMFYVHVKNDVEGIGHDHIYPEEIFDLAPEARLQGIAFLNDAPYFESREEELERAFLHELAHRWGARIHVAGEDPGALLGRDGEHWSYFLDTSSEGGVSPLEGNAWSASAGSYQSLTHLKGVRFSELDLYLMGLLAPEEVTPLRLLVPNSDPTRGFDGEEGEHVDCRGGPLRAASPPQHCEVMEMMGSERVLTIDEILEVEGARLPPAPPESELPLTASIGFHFFSPGTVAWSAEACRTWSERTGDLTEAFSEATRGRMLLENVTQGSSTCAELVASIPLSSSPPQGCSFVGPSRTCVTWGALFVLLIGGVRRVRTKHPTLTCKTVEA